MAVQYNSHWPGSMRVKLLSGVVVLGEAHSEGEVLELPAMDARYLIGSGRAEASSAAVGAPVVAPKSRVLADAQPAAEPPPVVKAVEPAKVAEPEPEPEPAPSHASAPKSAAKKGK